MNPWHDVKLNAEGNVADCIIEVPANSKVKYELDKDSGLLRVDRILSSSVHYPANYGFYPKTLCEDKDPLDVLVIGQFPIQAFSIMSAKVVGVIHMIDGGEADDKIIAVHADDPIYRNAENLEDISEHVVNECVEFFKTYKNLEGKKSVEISGVSGKEEAMKIFNESIELYNKTYK